MRTLLAILVLPFNMTVVIPALLLWFTGGFAPRWQGDLIWLSAAGAVLALCGLALMAHTITLFHRIGKGTLAPWSPTRRLVVAGAYRHLRNPMITGVATLLTGEALIFGSWPIGVAAAAFVAVNHVWFLAREEPGLKKRFGAEYDEYCQNVPRWLPRIKPWRPEIGQDSQEVQDKAS